MMVQNQNGRSPPNDPNEVGDPSSQAAGHGMSSEEAIRVAIAKCQSWQRTLLLRISMIQDRLVRADQGDQALEARLQKLLQLKDQLIETSQAIKDIDEKTDHAVSIALINIFRQGLDIYKDIYPSSFIIADLGSLIDRFMRELNLGEEQLTGLPREIDAWEVVPGAKEKFIYVRLYHRDMRLLLTGSFPGWLKPLINSLKTIQNHGLTVYSEEALARASISSQPAARRDRYCIVRLCIPEHLDITEAQIAKMTVPRDPTLRIIADLDNRYLGQILLNYKDKLFHIALDNDILQFKPKPD